MDGDDEMSSPSHPQIYPVASTESIPSLHKVTGTSTNGNNNNSSSSSSSNNLSESCFNQGYYDRFFVEVKKLGRGLRGSVFLVQHVLDTVFLGEYAVKSIPVGVSHSWLVRQLQEVHLLERLRHPNIIHYKHAWIENRQLSVFAPEVPCLFILMELANGGNLEEYIYLQHPDSSLTTFYTSTENFQQQHEITDRATRLKILRQQQRVRKRAAAAWSSEESLRARMFGGIGMDSDGRRVRYLTTRQIWSLFIDISEGLAHLHRNGIIHRDLKPPNLLLRFRDLKDPDEIPRVLISDFGECEVLGEKVQRVETPSARPVRTGATGTLEFMCPELLERDPVTGAYCHDHSVKGDMFSLGVVLYFLCYSRVPYSQVEDVDLLREEILRFHRVTFPTDGHERRVPAELNRLIDRLLARDPALRPTMDEVVSMCRLAGAAPQPAAAAATPAAIPKQNTATATAVAAAASTLSKPAPLAAAAAATTAATPSALEWKGMSIV
ncbi:putative serine/threonine-protein kinase iks1 [Entophlyctis luteolus]|nr:putative serine/threonine-protein kinase iks1 [Entophlyctis luteolus]